MLMPRKNNKVKFWLNICNLYNWIYVGYEFAELYLLYMYSKLFSDASEEASICGHTFANAGQALALSNSK
jgi:hypothetical protein